MLNITNIDKIVVKDAYDTFEVQSLQASSIEEVEITFSYPRRIVELTDVIFYNKFDDGEVEFEFVSFSVDFEVTLQINDSEARVLNYRAIDARVIEINRPIFGTRIEDDELIEQILNSINNDEMHTLSGREFFVDVFMKPFHVKAVAP